ncbi:MAG: response regulator [candidate division Zixibacteria bacterium]|nr:response regulator [candidate division Zixibacteria bacterium]
MCSESLASILIVDDQKNWRKVLSLLLKNDPYKVIDADSFENAKNKLDSRYFDLVVLDVRMVDNDTFNVDGLALLNYIRDNHPTTKTIILTGYPDSVKDRSQVDAFILKVPPGSTFDEQGFRNLVHRILNKEK